MMGTGLWRDIQNDENLWMLVKLIYPPEETMGSGLWRDIQTDKNLWTVKWIVPIEM
jgi:hypothetical protein